MSKVEFLLEKIADLLDHHGHEGRPGVLRGHSASKDGWQGSTQLQTGQYNRVQVLAANFPQAGEYTAEFNLTPLETSNLPIFAQALVTWSVEGANVTRLINIADGISISGVAQGITIAVMDATVPNNELAVIPNGATYVINVQVAKGVRGTNKQPPTLVPGAGTFIVPAGLGALGATADVTNGSVGVTMSAPVDLPAGSVLVFAAQPGAQYTIRAPVVASTAVLLSRNYTGPTDAASAVSQGNSVIVPVPVGSGAISVYSTVGFGNVAPEPDSGDVSVNQQLIVPGQNTFDLKTYDPRDYDDWVPLTPGTNQIQLVNFFDAAQALFSLTLGIDG
jgi:hypothetical protein